MQAHRIELVEKAHGTCGVRHQSRLGDLELERRGRDAVTAKHRAAAQDEARLAQLLQRQIERDATRVRHLALHLAVVPANPVQYHSPTSRMRLVSSASGM